MFAAGKRANRECIGGEVKTKPSMATAQISIESGQLITWSITRIFSALSLLALASANRQIFKAQGVCAVDGSINSQRHC